MRILLLGILLLAIVIGLVISLRRAEAPPSSEPAAESSPLQAQVPSATENHLTQPERAVATKPTLQPQMAPASGSASAPAPVNAPPDNDAAIAEWHKRHEERDYAYWDMKLNLLRKIQLCVGDKMQTLGAAEVDFHFKKQDGAWLADRAEIRDPDDEERAHMGAVDFKGADRELAQRCISESFAGMTTPIPQGTDTTDEYTVRGQVMFPTSADRAWQETGINP